jgi:hypothetical protein
MRGRKMSREAERTEFVDGEKLGEGDLERPKKPEKQGVSSGSPASTP